MRGFKCELASISMFRISTRPPIFVQLAFGFFGLYSNATTFIIIRIEISILLITCRQHFQLIFIAFRIFSVGSIKKLRKRKTRKWFDLTTKSCIPWNFRENEKLKYADLPCPHFRVHGFYSHSFLVHNKKCTVQLLGTTINNCEAKKYFSSL